MNLQLIRKYCVSYPGGLRKFAMDADMSEANLHRCIRNNKIQAGDIEALSRLLNVEMGIFFSESADTAGVQVNSRYGDVAWLYEKIELLEQRIKDKDATIADKDERIKILKRE